jgi:2-dehydropantoate 2-reductase
MQVLILGAGGLGTVLGAHLSQAGTDVTLLVKPTRAVEYAGLDDGQGRRWVELRVTGLSEVTASAWIAWEPEQLGSFDYLLVCVKGRDTEAAIRPLAGIDVGSVLSLQNGVAKDDLLVARFGKERVLGALTGVGGTLVRPGHAIHTLAGATLVGELDGSTSERGERLAALFRSAGLRAECVPDILTREWHKLGTFLPGALLCSITRQDVASAMLDPDLARLRARLCHEIAAIAAAEGHGIGHMPVWLSSRASGTHEMTLFSASEDAIAAEFAVQGEGLRAQPVPLYPSMTTDILNGRPTELEETAGDVLRRAARHGIAVPVMETCYRLVKSAERGNGIHHGGTEARRGNEE